MKFSLINILLVNTLVALGLGLVLTDKESKIRQHALQLQKDKQFIRESESWARQYPGDGTPRPLDSQVLYYFDHDTQLSY